MYLEVITCTTVFSISTGTLIHKKTRDRILNLSISSRVCVCVFSGGKFSNHVFVLFSTFAASTLCRYSMLVVMLFMLHSSGVHFKHVVFIHSRCYIIYVAMVKMCPFCHTCFGLLC